MQDNLGQIQKAEAIKERKKIHLINYILARYYKFKKKHEKVKGLRNSEAQSSFL